MLPSMDGASTIDGHVPKNKDAPSKGKPSKAGKEQGKDKKSSGGEEYY